MDSTQIVVPDFSEVRPVIKSDKIKEMLTVTRVGKKTFVKINSSSLGIILSCLRKAYYVLDRGLKSQTDSAALLFGLAIHKAMEVFYSYPRAERNIPPNFIECSNLMAYGSAAPSDHFLYKAVSAFVQAAQPLAFLPELDKRSIANGVWLLQHYFSTYINDQYVVAVDEKGPIVERTGEFILHDSDDLQIILFGTIDVVLKNLADGRLLPADHKTTSVLGSDFFNRLKPNHQYTGYILIAQHVLGMDVNEFLVNGIQVKEKPKTARGSSPNFSRQITTRSETDYIEFKQTVVWSVRALLQCQAENQFPLGHVDACTHYGGCQFLEVCSAPSQLRENILSAKFKVELPEKKNAAAV